LEINVNIIMVKYDKTEKIFFIIISQICFLKVKYSKFYLKIGLIS